MGSTTIFFNSAKWEGIIYCEEERANIIFGVYKQILRARSQHKLGKNTQVFSGRHRISTIIWWWNTNKNLGRIEYNKGLFQESRKISYWIL